MSIMNIDTSEEQQTEDIAKIQFQMLLHQNPKMSTVYKEAINEGRFCATTYYSPFTKCGCAIGLYLAEKFGTYYVNVNLKVAHEITIISNDLRGYFNYGVTALESFLFEYNSEYKVLKWIEEFEQMQVKRQLNSVEITEKKIVNV